MRRAISPVVLRALALVVSLVIASGAWAGKAIQVDNNGADSASCGTKSDPCRTITQAIANAPQGGAIEVGPGIYGDVNQNGTLGEAGEEPANIEMITIDKPLTITSRDGAGATILDGGDHSLDVVGIVGSGVVFGKAKKGFTVTGATVGIGVLGNGNKLSGNTITGNWDIGISVNRGTGANEIVGNRITGNGGVGIFLLDDATRVIENVITQNAGWAGAGGVLIRSSNNTISRNVLSANGLNGIYVETGVGNTIDRNSIIGNLAAGIHLEPLTGATITRSNIFGNNLAGTAAADGLENDSGSAISAAKNFWGVASGPGADPADDISGDPVESDPVARKAFRVRVQAAQ